MENIRFVTMAEALELHQDQILLFGGDSGIRDKGLLESALAMPRATYAGVYMHEDLVAMAGAYLYHLCKNHAFVDGNKRVAFSVMLNFLDMNGYKLEMDHQAAYELVIEVASGTLAKDQLTATLRRHVKPL